jgi:hypothetical protein
MKPAIHAEALGQRGRLHVMLRMAREADAMHKTLAAPLDELGPDVRRRVIPIIAELAEAVMAVHGDAMKGELRTETINRIGAALHAARLDMDDLRELVKEVMGTGPDDRAGVATRAVKRKHVDERMLAAIRDNHEAVYWSAQQWADKLNCAKSTVVESKTWKQTCKSARERERLARGRRLRAPKAPKKHADSDRP